jgi:hypothetical protein
MLHKSYGKVTDWLPGTGNRQTIRPTYLKLVCGELVSGSVLEEPKSKLCCLSKGETIVGFEQESAHHAEGELMAMVSAQLLVSLYTSDVMAILFPSKTTAAYEIRAARRFLLSRGGWLPRAGQGFVH